MLLEIFKKIDGYNYHISTFGRVFDVRREAFVKPCVATHNQTGMKYMQISLKDENGKLNTKKIHRLVAEAFIDNPKNKPCVDHISGDSLDNTIENLRWATNQENNMNVRTQCINGFKGITKNHHKYQSRIQYNRKKYNLGLHTTPEEAALCYNIAAKLLFNDYAYFNIVEKTENYKQLKYLTFYKLSKHFENIDDLVEKYKKYA